VLHFVSQYTVISSGFGVIS